MKKNLLLIAIMLLGFSSLYAGGITVYNNTCVPFTVQLAGNNFYGDITIPAGGSVSFTDPLDFVTDPAVTNTSTAGATTTANFLNLRGWTQPHINSFSINSSSLSYSSASIGWTVPCTPSTFNALWMPGTNVTAFIYL